MIGKIKTIFKDRNFGFILGENGEEFIFFLKDFLNIDNIEDLNISDMVDFEYKNSNKGKNREAFNIMKLKTSKKEYKKAKNTKYMKEIVSTYKISMEEIKKRAKILNIPHIINEKSFATLENIEKIVKFDEKNTTQTNFLKTITVEEIKKRYPIGTREIVRIAKILNIPHIINEKSYTSIANAEKIIDYFKEENNKKANMNNPNYKANFSHTQKDISFEIVVKQDYMIFCDTASLMSENCLKTFKFQVIPALLRYKKRIYIVDDVLKEIERNLKKSKKQKAENARKVLELLSKDDLYIAVDTAEYKKKTADEVLLILFQKYKSEKNLCLITNDNSYIKDGNLAGDIINLQKQSSVTSKKIKVFYISPNDNTILEFKENVDSNFTLHKNSPKRVKL